MGKILPVKSGLLFPSDDRNIGTRNACGALVGPVFIRRGDVLFVIKSPEQFLRSLHAGKFLPTDRILVKNKAGTDWIPLREVEQFHLDMSPQNSIAGGDIPHSENLFDRIRKPRFNISAFVLSGFWYFFHNMPDLAWKRLLPAVFLFGLLASLGAAFGLPAEQRIILLLFGWFSIASWCAVRADYDLNHLQVKRYRDEIRRRGDQSVQTENHRLNSSDPLQNPVILCTPTRKEKILN